MNRRPVDRSSSLSLPRSLSLNLGLVLSLTALASTLPAPAEDKQNNAPMPMKTKIISAEKAARTSFGQSITSARSIWIGCYQKIGTFTIREVLKGDASNKGKTVKLSEPLKMGCRMSDVPDLDSAVLVLNKKGEPMEVLDTTEQIDIIRTLVPIYAIADEKTRLTKLAEGYKKNPEGMYKDEMAWALGDIREKKNLDIIIKLYLDGTLKDKHRLLLQEYLASTLDQRVVPLLISALKTGNAELSSDAAVKLATYYPSKEVDTAFSAYLSSAPDILKPTMSAYLQKHNISVKGYVYSPPPFVQAANLKKEGKYKQALDMYLNLAAYKNNYHSDNSYVIRSALLSALDCASHLPTQELKATREKIIQTRLDWLSEDAESGNYLEVQETAEILRKLKDPRCLPALTKILQRPDGLFEQAALTASMGIHDLGPGGRNYGNAALIKRWGLLQKKPLSADLEADEGRALSYILGPSGDHQGNIRHYAICRLGELKDTRADEGLMKFYISSGYADTYLVEALRKIATPYIQEKLAAMAQDKNCSQQSQSLEILCDIQKEKALPVIRRVLKEGSLAGRTQAANQIARYGTQEDRKMVLALASVWTGDRPNHYWLVLALGQLNEKFKI